MIFLFYVSVIFFGLASTRCERLHEQIYSSISGSNACFRRLNGTHQAGCSTPQNGAVGVVQMIKGVDDAKWLVTEAVAGPYMAIVNTSLFNNIIELFMEKPENIAGVLIYDQNDSVNRAKSFSLESQCPNEYASDPESSQCSSTQPGAPVWNAKGSGLLRRDIPFPIIFSSAEHSEDIDKIEECYERYNKDRDNQRGKPLCSVEMNAFMFAAVSTELCMRRSASTSLLTPTKVCDPIGDYNVYYPLFPSVEKKENTKNVTLVTARVDAASLFDNISPGAASSVVGMTTLVSTAALLAKMIPETDADKYDHNILFTFFNGEAFDYIGSQRVAYDISKGAWPSPNPLKPESIKLHVEVGQIGGALQDQASGKPNIGWPMYAFTPFNQSDPKYSDLSEEITQFINTISRNYNRFNESVLPQFTANIPPSSIHSFRRILKNYTDTTLPELVLVDHEETFTNMYYNSALDEYYQLGYSYRNISIGNNGTFISTEELIATGTMVETDMQVKISRLATALALTLYRRVTDADYIGNLTASAHLVDEMLYCYTQSQACPLMQAVDFGSNSADNLSPTAPYMYASVAHNAANPAVFTAHLLCALTGTELNLDKSACKAQDKLGYDYYWLKGWNHTGACYQTTMNMSDAVSPAFDIEGYDLKSNMYSTWTESVWRGMSARLFVSAGGAGATAALASGVAVTIVAIFLTYWMKKHKDVVFVNVGTLTTSDDATSGQDLNTARGAAKSNTKK